MKKRRELPSTDTQVDTHLGKAQTAAETPQVDTQCYAVFITPEGDALDYGYLISYNDIPPMLTDACYYVPVDTVDTIEDAKSVAKYWWKTGKAPRIRRSPERGAE